MGLLYRCKKCEFVSHNYDSCRNHKCFAYGGGRKRKSETTPTKGEGKKVKKSGEGNEEENEEKDERVIVIE